MHEVSKVSGNRTFRISQMPSEISMEKKAKQHAPASVCGGRLRGTHFGLEASRTRSFRSGLGPPKRPGFSAARDMTKGFPGLVIDRQSVAS